MDYCAYTFRLRYYKSSPHSRKASLPSQGIAVLEPADMLRSIAQTTRPIKND